MAFKSVGEILKGDSSKPGQRYTVAKGATYTRAPTSDPKVPGGTYLSVTRPDGSKTTHVFDSGGKRVK